MKIEPGQKYIDWLVAAKERFDGRFEIVRVDEKAQTALIRYSDGKQLLVHFNMITGSLEDGTVTRA